MKRIVLSLLIVGLIGAMSPLVAQKNVQTARVGAVASVPDPAEQIRDMARLLRSNDLASLVRSTVPPSIYQEMRLAYELQRLQPTTEAQRAQFAEKFSKINAPDAVEQLMAQIEPKLVEARPQVPAALMMGFGALQMAILSEDSDLTADQRATLQQALPGFQQWATTTDFLSSESVRQALTLVTNAARNTGIRSLDELKLMSFEQVLSKAEIVVAAGKQALLIYGLDVNAIADSMQVEVLSIDSKTARVRATVTVFGAQISSEHDLVLLEGRWYGKQSIAHSSANAEHDSHS